MSTQAEKTAIRKKYNGLMHDLTLKRNADRKDLEAKRKQDISDLQSRHNDAVKALEEKYHEDWNELGVAMLDELEGVQR